MEKAEQKLALITKYFSDFTDEQIARFARLENLYHEWNNQINVISRKDIGSLYEKHILHSLSIAAVFEFTPGTQVLDLGTGGGFPGIPLAIFFPEVKFLLADSIGKKIKVVQAVADELGLENVTARHTRAEDIKDHRFDTVVSRAVAPLKDLWKWSKPLLRKNPSITKSENPYNGLICLKGGDLAIEIAESGLRPRAVEIGSIFEEEYFKDKYILHVAV